MNLKKGMIKSDIERELQGKGDFVIIDTLTRFDKEDISMDIRRFVYLKLIEVYERRGMFAEAAKLYIRLAEFSLTADEKIKYLTKEIESNIKAGFFDRVDLSIKKTLTESKPSEKIKILTTVKGFYMQQAEVYEKEKRKSNAIKIYEKMLTMELSVPEKKEIEAKLLKLYENLGLVKEYMNLKARFDRG